MTDQAYLQALKVTRASISFAIDKQLFSINGRPVESVAFTPPNSHFAEGAAMMSFENFNAAISLAAANKAAAGLSDKDREALNFITRDFNGVTSQLIAPYRYVVFDAVRQGSLVFLDQLEPSSEPTNLSSANCRRL